MCMVINNYEQKKEKWHSVIAALKDTMHLSMLYPTGGGGGI